jgi:hypothetical protein
VDALSREDRRLKFKDLNLDLKLDPVLETITKHQGVQQRVNADFLQ